MEKTIKFEKASNKLLIMKKLLRKIVKSEKLNTFNEKNIIGKIKTIY